MIAVAAAVLVLVLAVAGGPPPSSAAASPGGATGVRPGTGWGWPISPVPVVVRPFTAPPTPWSAGHRGVDLLTPAGTLVLAPADGVIAFAGPVAGRGVVAVQHDGGRRSALEPVLPLVTRGARVARGDPVAVVGDNPGHCAPRTCLHWGVRQDGRYVDPLSLVGRSVAPAVLLPLRASPAARAGSVPAGSVPAGSVRAGSVQRWPATLDAAPPWPPWWATASR